MHPQLYFVCDVAHPDVWRDGLWAAMQLLRAHYDVTTVNVAKGERPPSQGDHILLAWGAFESPAERACRPMTARVKALQMGGVAAPMGPMVHWPIVFAETRWHQERLREFAQQHHCRTRILTAFGCNTDIYQPIFGVQKLFDWITVGGWSTWKRQHLLALKHGTKLAVGEHYADINPQEAPPIIADHLRAGITVSPYVPPERLAQLYNISRACYIPADVNGGGERAVLEARACGLAVVVEPDNPKLAELAAGTIYTHHHFAAALREGLETRHG